MFIRDNETNRVRAYGINPHDSLVISQDGSTLSYYNLQNGDGSIGGGYSFTDEDGNIPKEVENLEGLPFFNIGGFNTVSDDLSVALFDLGYKKAVSEMLGAFERCKAWMREKDETKVDAIETMEQIIKEGLQGVNSPHSGTKKDEG